MLTEFIFLSVNLYDLTERDREWWEIIVTLRKVAMVCVGTFGSLMGAVEVQACLALAIIFLSIVLHLLFSPFGHGTDKVKKR